MTRTRPGVVQVRGQMAGRAARSSAGRLSVGTGFVVSSEGLVLTNEHVVRETDDLKLRLFDGREITACVVGVDVTTDIALLRARLPAGVVPLPLGDPAHVKAGEDVFVIGSPFGFDHSVSAGILSAKDRIVDRSSTAEGSASAPYAFYLQTDAAINMGNSGGPLLSRQGQVIGVASAYWGGAQPAQGIGFAIPIDVVKRLIPQLAGTGRVVRSRVGVEVQAVDALLAEAFGLSSTRGALLAAVEAEGPAARAGLEAGDLVVAWDDHDIASVEDFKIYAQLTPPSTRVTVKALRRGKRLQAVLQLVAAPSSVEVSHAAACADRAANGLPPLGLDLGKAAPGGGVVVRNVGAGAARDAGLLPGDVIVQIRATRVRSASDLLEALRPGGVVHAVLVRREQSSFWLALPPHVLGP